MASRGGLLGDGLLDGARPVRVFQDLDSTGFVFAQSKRSDEEFFVAVERIQLLPRQRRR